MRVRRNCEIAAFAHAELVGRRRGAVAEGKELGDLAIAARQRVEPCIHVEFGADDVERTGCFVLNEDFAPLVLIVLLAIVKRFDLEVFSRWA